MSMTREQIEADAAEHFAEMATIGEPELQRPTVSGKVAGIVGLDPMILQCWDCGRTLTSKIEKIALFIILSGWHFHRCEGQTGKRRCRECLERVKADCPLGGCRR